MDDFGVLIGDLNERRRLRQSSSGMTAVLPPPVAQPGQVQTVPVQEARRTITQIPTFGQTLRLIREDGSMMGDPMDNPTPVAVPGSETGGEDWKEKLGGIVAEIMTTETDPAVMRKKILAAMAMAKGEKPPEEEPPMEEPPAGMPPEEEEEPPMEESIKLLKHSPDPAEKELYESIVKIRKATRKNQRELTLHKEVSGFKTKLVEAENLCKATKLKDLEGGLQVAFLEQVAVAKDEKGKRRLIEDRIQVLTVAQKPRSSPGHINAVASNEDQTKAIAADFKKVMDRNGR